MSVSTVAVSAVTLTGGNYTTVIVVALIALLALVVAGLLVREVLAFDEGTDSMKSIAAAIQEGASAYLSRQFKTLSIFAVIVFFVLFLLPANTTGERIGRSIFFLVGAVFSAVTGYVGMWLAVRANVRVAAAARDGNSGEPKAMRIAFRTGGVARAGGVDGFQQVLPVVAGLAVAHENTRRRLQRGGQGGEPGALRGARLLEGELV